MSDAVSATQTTAVVPARAGLVGLDTGARSAWPVSESLGELERLAQTADIQVVARFTQRLAAPNARTLIGSGKVAEIKEAATSQHLDVLIFDDELSPRQQANLEKEFGDDIRVMDRTALILDIFALHATTREGKLQVELATLEYELPRLRGKWSHLEAEKLGGGVGARFGMGESQLETDRRMARRRIADLKVELARVAKERAVQRSRRQSSGVFRVALVGYTNAGKSSLLNALTDSDVLAWDKLFATLDSTTRRFELPGGRETTLTDTVGFIHKLPHGLVAAFRSTLEEVTDADLLLHVVDVAGAMRDEQIAAVGEVLEEINAHRLPTLMVFNKCDLLDNAAEADGIRSRFPGSVFVSAQTGYGLDHLVSAIEAQAAKSSTLLEVVVPFDRGELVQVAHTRTTILEESYTAEGTRLKLRVPADLLAKFAEYAVS